MSTLIRIPTGHMRFVPAHRQSDDMTVTLSPAKWLVELVLISNKAVREKCLDQFRIHKILAPAIPDVCHITPALTKFFPRKNDTNQRALPQHERHLTRPIPRCPANITTTGMTAPTTPHMEHYRGASSDYVPNLGNIRPNRLPGIPLRIVEFYGGLTTGLEALLKAGYEIGSNTWIDTGSDSHAAASHRIAYLILQFPHLPHRRLYMTRNPDFRWTSAPSPRSSSVPHFRRESTSSL